MTTLPAPLRPILFLVLMGTTVSACCASTPEVQTPPAEAPPAEVPPADPMPVEVPPEPTPADPTVKPPSSPDEALRTRCVEPLDYASMPPEDAATWRAGCKPAFECDKPLAPRACCLAMTPDCLRCADLGKAEKAAYDFACFGETSPLPEVVDCKVPPALTPCCKALIPKCLDCVAKNRHIAELYRQQCGDGR